MACVRSAAALGIAMFAGSACTLLVDTGGFQDGTPDAGNLDGSPGVRVEEASSPSPEGGDPALLAPHLVGAWSFDEGAGTVARDATSYGRHASLIGKAAFTSAGKRGSALRLQRGANDYVEMPALDGEGFPASGTLSLWLRYGAPAGPEEISILDQWDSSREHLFVRHPDNDPQATRFQFAAQRNAADYDYLAEFSLPIDTWVHLVIGWDETAKRGKLVVDGKRLDLSDYVAAFRPSGQRMRLGRNLSGSIDEVRLYDVMLDDAAIAVLP